MTHFTATYDPTDNKIRLSASERLDPELYRRVNAAGFAWAPHQKIFVAPMWTPEREDLALELAGAIDDEDTSLVERAEDRSGRFEDYKEKRAHEAERTYEAVETLANGIPLGQPLLIGHHSERHARRDAERIRNGMTKAVRLWETSAYWERRAKGAMQHAKYKERSDVRARRIKGLEADVRKHEKTKTRAEGYLAIWRKPDLTLKQALFAANYGGATTGTWSKLDAGTLTAAEAAAEAVPQQEAIAAGAQRWLAHLANRLLYERTMLQEDGGLPADRFAIEVGGQILVKREWGVVTRVTRKDGRIVSVTAASRFFGGVRGIEEVLDYRPPAPGDAEKVKAKLKKPPLCNFPSEGCRTMAKAEWDDRAKHGYNHQITTEATAEHGAYRQRAVSKPGTSYSVMLPVYCPDAKRVDPPPPPTTCAEPGELPDRHLPELRAPREAPTPDPQAAKFEALKEGLRAGITVVSAPQLFPTPPALAARMVALADIHATHDVLEPSAGTGNLLRALLPTGANVLAVEIHPGLAEALKKLDVAVVCADFLDRRACAIGTFDRILMNPPFGDGQDIAHIQHALTLLNPGGRLVALCANGPRQQDKLRPLVAAYDGTWEDLPDGSFHDAGTNVRVALLVFQAPGVSAKADPGPAPATARIEPHEERAEAP